MGGGSVCFVSHYQSKLVCQAKGVAMVSYVPVVISR